MFTNTYLPHVGGVARSVDTLCSGLRRRGHKVLVIAPTFKGHEEDTPGVMRVPALKHMGNSDYSMPIPLSRSIQDEIDAFGPDIVHSHHPFLLGHTALRVAATCGVPLVYTYHTRYDIYVRQFVDSQRLWPDLVRNLANGYANLADAIIAPSQSMKDLLLRQEVRSPISVIPTGIDTERFAKGNCAGNHKRPGLTKEDVVVGHLGRLTAEKNLDFLFAAAVRFLEENPKAQFIFAGDGPMRAEMTARLDKDPVRPRMHFLGPKEGDDVVAFYSAIDVFAFASRSETQGLVVAEALASGVPVVALDASGVRDALRHCASCVQLGADASPEAFAAALSGFAGRSTDQIEKDRIAARAGAEPYSIAAMLENVEALYAQVSEVARSEDQQSRSEWERILEGLAAEVDMLENLFRAVGITLLPRARGALR
jgi:glycosyltransferase involved in cell wall biosynthesis